MYETRDEYFMRPRPITVRPKKWSRDHAGLETLTSLTFTNNTTAIL